MNSFEDYARRIVVPPKHHQRCRLVSEMFEDWNDDAGSVTVLSIHYDESTNCCIAVVHVEVPQAGVKATRVYIVKEDLDHKEIWPPR